MGADPTADELARMADEHGDFTYLYLRANDVGWVRDAKPITDAGSLDVADVLFAGWVEGVQVRLCAVLRGRVATVDDFEFADQPDVTAEPYASRLASFERRAGRRRFTVYGCWDTGDGPRRYSKRVEAVDADHAELLVRRDKTVGEFLVAAVVEGFVPVEDSAAIWAAVDGKPALEPAPEPARRPAWLLPAVSALTAALIVIALILVF